MRDFKTLLTIRFLDLAFVYISLSTKSDEGWLQPENFISIIRVKISSYKLPIPHTMRQAEDGNKGLCSLKVSPIQPGDKIRSSRHTRVKENKCHFSNVEYPY